MTVKYSVCVTFKIQNIETSNPTRCTTKNRLSIHQTFAYELYSALNHKMVISDSSTRFSLASPVIQSCPSLYHFHTDVIWCIRKSEILKCGLRIQLLLVPHLNRISYQNNLFKKWRPSCRKKILICDHAEFWIFEKFFHKRWPSAGLNATNVKNELVTW